MGSWTHGAHSVTHSGDADIGPQSILDNNLDRDYNVLRLRVFDRWLKGMDNGWEEEPLVKIFVMGGSRCRTEREWPPARARDTGYYLLPEGGLSNQMSQEISAPSSYLFDPERPVPTIEGNISPGQPIMEAGGCGQRE